MQLNVKAFALTCGIIFGLAVCLATVWLLAFGFDGTVMINLDHFFFGYSYSYIGAVVGGIWAFFEGFIGGWLFAWLYNTLSGG